VRGLYMAEGAMLAQQMKLETTGNNLSNQHTPGYNKDQTVQTSFAEWLVARTGSGGGRPGGLTPVGSMAYNVAIDEEYTHMTQGELEETGRELDFALTGGGFFEVEVDGEVRYTRNGRFFLDEEGFLVDTEGNMVQGEDGPINLSLDETEGQETVVEQDGSIYVGGEQVDQLQVVAFDEEAELVKEGDNLYEAEEAPLEEPVEATRVWQGFIENSNVDLAREMVDMLEARNGFETAQRVMITQDAILETAANELGALR